MERILQRDAVPSLRLPGKTYTVDVLRTAAGRLYVAIRARRKRERRPALAVPAGHLAALVEYLRAIAEFIGGADRRAPVR